MGMSTAVQTYSIARLNPLFPGFAEMPINIPPGVSYTHGQVMAQVSAAAADVQTITITGSPTGGTFTISGTNPTTGATFTTSPAYNVATATLQTTLQGFLGAGNILVTGTAGSSYVLTAAGTLANRPLGVVTVSGAGLTGGTSPAAAVVHTTTGQTAGTYAAYVNGGSGGLGTAKGLLSWDVSSDANGNITWGPGGAGGEWGQSYLGCPMCFRGTYRTVDLVGLDATALGQLGRLISGSVADGIMEMY